MYNARFVIAGLMLCGTLGCRRAASVVGPAPFSSGASLASDVALDALAPTVTSPTKVAHELRFVAMGDTGKGNEGQRRVAESVHAFCTLHGCDLVLLLGDNIYESGVASVDDPLWQSRFEQPYASSTQPFFAVLGNHDYGHGGIGDDFDRGAVEVAYSAHSTKWHMPAAHYRLVAGPAEILGLDTNRTFWGHDDGQTQAVRGWTASQTSPWRIVAGHHPYLSNGPHGNAGAYNGAPSALTTVSGTHVKRFLEDEVCGKSDVYLSAHDHVREWLEPTCKGTELVVSGAGAAPTSLRGSNLSRFSSAELGFVYLMATPHELTVQMVHVSGTVEFARTLGK